MKNDGRLKKIYRITSLFAAIVGVAYLLVLAFPQPLFAYSMEYGKFQIHSREPIAPEMVTVLDLAEKRLTKSPIYDTEMRRDVYLTGSFRMYTVLSHKAYNSFANSVPFIDNVFINKTDVAADRVMLDREIRNSRSLSGVIAHEIAHLFIRKRYGRVASQLIPTWKNEGYCEYVAGDSTMPLDEAIRIWRENPEDEASYRYAKYHLMVRHLLEREGVSVDELFRHDFDEKAVEARTLAAL